MDPLDLDQIIEEMQTGIPLDMARAVHCSVV